MAALNFDTETTELLLNEKLAQHNVKPRNYLGMSQLAQNCKRALVYYFRHCYEEDIDAKTMRIFRTGHKAEDDLIADLKAAGIEVYGEQTEFSVVSGHCKGHLDALGKGFPESPDTEHVIEFKTSNDANFKKLLKEGVKLSKPTHYGQMNLYGYLHGVSHAMYMVVNKNTSEYYFERIEIDKKYAETLLEQAELLITADTLPDKIGNGTASWFECKWCSCCDICHNNKPITPSCRNCQHVSLEPEGKWACTKNVHDMSTFTPCREYKLEPFLESSKE